APPQTWDVPEGTPMVGEWRPGSWGGHSMWAIGDYDEEGFWAPHTWNMKDQKITWRAAAAYLDEAHVIIDSLNAWRKNKAANKFINLGDVRDAVNAVSSIQVP
ncbi:MAG TPA: hypothetical protein VNJ04_16880, partial [Gemmatimonadaceae bacterium]|nr:hypothetical protein [Gemmatimonadaceae bacterium]